ncbi:hypothetical protein OOK13_29715 [Streptomyces sp. NBC_00378]|uniref:hypothetical protein n=1 Tax=unclassified Streptomyces TaxID=2593676 RepID=UPI002255AE25|nr:MULTISPECIES: hypothetical protein [unclassified Streptomyces]MCX5112574.1 hypothetical protein [Streptomyces sp. NBC_00378]
MDERRRRWLLLPEVAAMAPADATEDIRRITGATDYISPERLSGGAVPGCR